MARSYLLKNFPSLNFIILNIITVSCCFAHSFKIICVPKPIIPFRSPPQPVQFLCSGRGGEIDVPYIRSIDGRVPKTYELWPLAEDGVCEVHPYARVRLLSEFREDTFPTHFFNARWFQIPFLGCRVVKLTCRLDWVHVVVVDSVGRVLDKYLYGLVRTS